MQNLSKVGVVVEHGWLEQVGLAHLETLGKSSKEESDILETQELSQGGALVDKPHVDGGGVDGVQQVAEEDPVPEGVGQVLHRGVGPGDPVVGREDREADQPLPTLLP